ncbi:MAG: hypothetical protein HGA19_03585, partial [Oscillochloris sp.]|nr:hypothetical protein [Oscillochloris sp.]
LLVAVSAAIDAELIVRQCRQLNPQLHIVARATQLSQLEVLHALGIHEVVQPEFEAGLEMVRQVLLHCSFPPDEIERLSDSVRNEHYRPITGLQSDTALPSQLRRARRALEIGWFSLPEHSPLVGQSIGVSAVRQRTGASIVAVLRDSVLMSNPGPETMLHAGDQVAALGTLEQRAVFQHLLCGASASELLTVRPVLDYDCLRVQGPGLGAVRDDTPKG